MHAHFHQGQIVSIDHCFFWKMLRDMLLFEGKRLRQLMEQSKIHKKI